MGHTRAVAALLAASVLLAGCIGVPGTGGGDGATAADGSGTVTLYVSDQPGAIEEFERLEVTVDGVAYRRAASARDGADGPSPDDGALRGEGWETYEVDDRTVDLTELRGENATAVGQQRLPEGSYDRVVLFVSEVDGTLTDGSSADVTLSSARLHLAERFTVGSDESVDFVYDATVVDDGESGGYTLTPVAAGSGVDAPIKEVGRDDASGLGARFVGEVDRGEAATVRVTRHGRPVAGATVTMGGRTYTTAGDGTVTFDVPAAADAAEVGVEYEGTAVSLTRRFPGRGNRTNRAD